MFKKVDCTNSDTVTIVFDGKERVVPAGITVTAAVLILGVGVTRISQISGTHRAPYCQMGVCFECLMEIDDIPNQQGCLIYVKEGMKIKRDLDYQKGNS